MKTTFSSIKILQIVSWLNCHKYFLHCFVLGSGDSLTVKMLDFVEATFNHMESDITYIKIL